MSSEPDTKGRQYLNDLQKARRRVGQIRSAVRREITNEGQPTHQTKAEFGAAMADFQDLLETYRSENALQEPFNERLPISDLSERVNQTVEKTVVVNSTTGREERNHFPVIVKLHHDVLIRHSKELNSIFKELGFAASARSKTETSEATEDDLKGLLKARGQTEALENLPNHFLDDQGDDS